MAILLTDDEVASVAIQFGIAWQYPLPTIENDQTALLNAGARGARSLIARGLANSDGKSLTIDEAASTLVTKVGGATRSVVAYVAPRSNSSSLSGSSIYLYQGSNESETDVLDLVSASGIHDLRESTHAEAVAVFLAAMENAFLNGIQSDRETSLEPALFAKASDGDETLCVMHNILSFGQTDTADEETMFIPSRVAEVWNSAVVGAALGLVGNVTLKGKG